MGELAIQAHGLGKRYFIGERQRYKALRDTLAQSMSAPIRALAGRARGSAGSKHRPEFWAIRDVSFEIEQGEVVGIVGRNGAGKSTLLKVLSRITEPTAGYAMIHGRVGSLLEVGTGFHPELTGRENIYLNGAVLGMPKSEIERKFDEIVEFAEVSKFLDTPVKHYSSGMYLRLAFAVAAHLEPEILLVDEVLAVGDAAFQKKCLGKMSDVARAGRTVLFVSHNMEAILNLCQRTILLERGTVSADGDTRQVIESYLKGVMESASIPLAERTDRKGNQRLKFTGVTVVDAVTGEPLPQPMTGQAIKLLLHYRSSDGRPLRNVHVSMPIHGMYDEKLFHLASNTSGSDFEEVPPEGTFECFIPRLPLQPGRYTFNVYSRVGADVADWVQGAGILDVAPGDFFGSGRLPPANQGSVLVEHRWQVSAPERLFVLSGDPGL